MIEFKETAIPAKWFPVQGEVELTYKAEQQDVNKPKFYIVVETPEGKRGKDIAGIYAEALARSEQIEQLGWARRHG